MIVKKCILCGIGTAVLFATFVGFCTIEGIRVAESIPQIGIIVTGGIIFGIAFAGIFGSMVTGITAEIFGED